MAANATSTRRRRPGRKADDIRRAWREQAPDAVFAGKSLADLEALMSVFTQVSEQLKVLEQTRAGLIRTRNAKLRELAEFIRILVRGVEGHPDYGDDSPLYRSMGFVPYSERGSGLTRNRKSRTAGGTASGQEETVA
jgi:hypothetical protein